jgi:hypothetical protein
MRPCFHHNEALRSGCCEANFYEVFGLAGWIRSRRVDGIPKVLEAVNFGVVVPYHNNSVCGPIQTLSFQTRGVKKAIRRIKMTTLPPFGDVHIPVRFICGTESFTNENRIELAIGRSDSLFFGPIHGMKRRMHFVRCVSCETRTYAKNKAEGYRRKPIQAHAAQFSAGAAVNHGLFARTSRKKESLDCVQNCLVRE